MKRLWTSVVALAAVLALAACSTPLPTLTTPFFVVTRGDDTLTSDLARVDAYGDTTFLGDTGHAMATIKADPTDGTLYAVTRSNDPGGCDTCLVMLDETDGSASGAVSITTPAAVPNIAIADDGTMYAIADDDNLYTVDPATGSATLVGATGVDASGGGAAFDLDGRLILTNSAGDVFEVDTATGAASLLLSGADLADAFGYDYPYNTFIVRGDIDPDSGEYWGVSPSFGYAHSSSLVRIGVDGASITAEGTFKAPDVFAPHMIAFEP